MYIYKWFKHMIFSNFDFEFLRTNYYSW